MTAHDSEWKTVKNDPELEVYSKVAGGTVGNGLNMFKVKAKFPNVVPSMMYDSLHDPDFRKTWDDNMLEGFNLCQLDSRNDIGYYGAKFPRFISNRDFLNQRFWMEFDNGEFMICNHTIEHAKCPPKKGFVRALSFLTGFYIQPLRPGQGPEEKGACFSYMSHADPKGSIPTWVNNMVSSTLIPSLIGKLDTNAQNYVTWAKNNKPAGWVAPWKTPKLSWDAKSVDDLPGKEETAPQEEVAAKARSAAPPAAAAAAAVSSSSNGGHQSREAPGGGGGGAGGDHLSVEKESFLDDQRKEQAALSLAPIPAQLADDDKATQHYRATMHGACNFVDRQFVQEGKVPSLAEYLSRLRGVLQGARFGLSPTEDVGSA